jgi:hypothetical protein
MQQPLAPTRSHHMSHSNTFSGIDVRPTTEHVFKKMGVLATLAKGVIVALPAMILAWKPRLGMLLGRFIWWVFPWLRGA